LSEDAAKSLPPGTPELGESRWPMALAVLTAAVLRATMPASLRLGDASWMLAVFVVVMLVVLMIGDPGRIDRQDNWLRVLTQILIGVITIVNAAAATQLVVGIVNGSRLTQESTTLLGAGGAIWLTNVIAFGLWYWELDRGGAAARAHGTGEPAFIFPEMTNDQYVSEDWYPKFLDYLYLSFNTASAFSPTDVSAVRPWAKLLMLAEDVISLVVAVLVIARAVSILK
jgi:hypothetical protein